MEARNTQVPLNDAAAHLLQVVAPNLQMDNASALDQLNSYLASPHRQQLLRRTIQLKRPSMGQRQQKTLDEAIRVVAKGDDLAGSTFRELQASLAPTASDSITTASERFRPTSQVIVLQSLI